MSRRALLAAPLALGVAPAAYAAMPAAASVLEAQRPPHALDAIRERIARVVETFTRQTIAFPVPMSPEEAAAALGMTDAEIEALDAPLAFAVRWGVSLDWLLAGDVTALIFHARHGISLAWPRAAEAGLVAAEG